MTELHLQIKKFYEEYLLESEKFDVKGVKASATRARKALGTRQTCKSKTC